MPNNYRSSGMPPKMGPNSNKKGENGVYDKHPQHQQYPHSMSSSTVPIKFAESSPQIPATNSDIANSARSSGVGKIAPLVGSGPRVITNAMRKNRE